MSPVVVRQQKGDRQRRAPSGGRDRRLWIGVGLICAGIAVMAVRAAVPPSELARRGVRTFGEVLFKDSKPAADGTFLYTVTFVYADNTQRNHQVTRVVQDKAVWDRLKARQEVRVLYLPEAPDEASIQGAEGLARPRAAAYAYLSWSAILAGLVLVVLALKSGSTLDRADRSDVGRERTQAKQQDEGGAS